MKDSTNNKRYETTNRILRYYTNTELPEHLNKEVKVWLISSFHKAETQQALLQLWNDSDPVINKNKKKAWKAVCKKIGWTETNRIILNRKTTWQIAAVIIPLFIIGGTSYVSFKNSGKETEISEILPVRTVLTTTDESKSIILGDGTEVRLNKNSELSYIEERNIQLKGEAFFIVKNQEAQPFTVQADSILITVTGTSFNICSYPDEEEMIITLFEGSLNLSTPNTTLIMHPGEEWSINRNDYTLYAVKTTRSAPAWNREYIIYNEVPLREIFRDLETKYNVRIKNVKGEISNDRLFLKVEADTCIDEIFYLLSQLSGKFEYAIEKNTIYIY